MAPARRPHERVPAEQLLGRVWRRAGIVGVKGRPLASFHGLRPAIARIMLARDVLLTIVSRQLGHAKPHITATIYAHLRGDSEFDQAARD
jgi:integrase